MIVHWLIENYYLSNCNYFWKNIILKIYSTDLKNHSSLFSNNPILLSSSYYKFKLLKILKIYFNLLNRVFKIDLFIKQNIRSLFGLITSWVLVTKIDIWLIKMVLVRRVINFCANGNQTLQCKETHVDTFIYSIFYYL